MLSSFFLKYYLIGGIPGGLSHWKLVIFGKIICFYSIRELGYHSIRVANPMGRQTRISLEHYNDALI